MRTPFVLFVLLLPAAASAQPADTLRLGRVTVTAERVPLDPDRAAAAVTVVTAEDIERRPVQTLADVLRLTPGFAFLNGDGAGTPPAATVRGFYGGGEAEYVLVLVDGRPVNDVETGVVDWELVALDAIERVEVVRGGASSLWGDAAVGAVVNVVTQEGPAPLRAGLSGGTYDTGFASLSGGGAVAGRNASAYGSVKRYGGFRDNAERTVGLAGGRVDLTRGGSVDLAMSTHHAWTEADLPGPLLASALADSRSQSAPFYRFDGTDERRHQLALDGRWRAASAATVDGAVFGGVRQSEVTRTLPLSPEFGDTQRREIDGARLEANATVTLGSLARERPALGVPARLLVGATGSLQSLGSAYAPVVAGAAQDYLGTTPDPDAAPAAQGDGSRRAAGVFVQAEVSPVDALRLVAGLRLDALRDEFAAVLPQAATSEATHTAWSPRVGANLRWLATARQVGHVYVNAGRHFKAPTLDQLFDQRTIGVPFPPFAVSLSNAALRPQRGTSVEAGLTHRARLGAALAEATLAAYRIDMEDEIDFSLQDFAYGNIGESLHRGVEAGLAVSLGGASVFGTYTYTEATVEGGDFAGRFLKAIPRDVWAVGASAVRGPLTASLTARGAGRVWLDDANTIPLASWAALDARLAYRLPVADRAVSVVAEAFNLTGAEYATTGFPDASGAGTPSGGPRVYLYPAAGRQLRLGLSLSL
ncbi:TonB-dependent receptor [Rubrivirga sp. S365]|uniref:TonB-dependent receptor n=1 Tax=Rubrivirga sp. S365 TaxID=3076080 RepID=UPI0028C7CC18|nr:TonB-dependent receptor [Rubrivirga sp. S365]MDT7858056.1 TonB-dependent receptor [Rubrivirga sp. S365]